MDCTVSGPMSCSLSVDANETHLTSLSDLKFKSLFHAKNYSTFVQLATESGFSRNFPYTRSSAYAHPTSCLIADITMSYCKAAYQQTSCGTPAIYPTYYPPYDPRCRVFYRDGLKSSVTDKVFFLYPKPTISVGNLLVVSGVIPLKAAGKIDGTFYGVYSANFLVSRLSDSINFIHILKNGYSYVIDAYNTTQIIIHPKASLTCGLVSCAEGFISSAEYNSFLSNVLLPIQKNALSGSKSQAVETTYIKNGATWRLAYSTFDYDLVHYAVISTVPLTDIREASNDVQHSISDAVNQMIAIFIACIVVFVVSLIFFIWLMIKSIVAPINQLTKICNQIRPNVMSNIEVPTVAFSLDMKILLSAFANLIVALKFSSEELARGGSPMERDAIRVFERALQVYTLLGNQKGIGACLNNLGNLELMQWNFVKAKDYFMRAVQNAGEMLQPIIERKGDESRVRRTLSDRNGNLAMLYLHMGELQSAFNILGAQLEDDKQRGYIRGCVVKQGNLGHFYLKQQEFIAAETVFVGSLRFIQRKDEKLSVLYDAITAAVHTLTNGSTANDWIVALTDGQDSGSKTSLLKTSNLLSSSNVNLLVIGVGEDVDVNLLQALVKCTKKGAFVFASGDKKSISDAFQEVISHIQGHMMMEEI